MTVFVDVMPASSKHSSVRVYTRPFLAVPERSERRFTVSGPVICQSPAVAPSSPVTWTMRHVALQLSATLTVTDTATIAPSGGQRAFGEAVMLEMLANGNE